MYVCVSVSLPPVQLCLRPVHLEGEMTVAGQYQAPFQNYHSLTGCPQCLTGNPATPFGDCIIQTGQCGHVHSKLSATRQLAVDLRSITSLTCLPAAS